ncbi:FkbM family methyltransferase [Streptomonospora nanhaiensis]|uniref:FkbM family methyltransferase n=1 Tax=Streptomonospora nanhaiensis TaxID=1323731 RepID=A0A853BMD3_9ACTN|nr:FkbM family methyltransferase [Streptomonospora nanhaiensis]MBV2367133.1 FkbM family methyltransferase [Streptomonospora nanhaiensis]MBX9390460.1 FkbM family methyltransferase [Streptomonospora nanhaiensis]NYI95827.1 FkbM family methyltransferase [Streptomonospora nanhaiensis]
MTTRPRPQDVPAPRSGPAPLRAVGAALRGLSPHAFFIEREVAGLAEVVRPGAVCLDVGAEYGLYTFTLADLAGPAGAVYAVEPLPGPARFLTTAASALGADNVRVLRRALAREEGTGTLSLPLRRGLPVHGRAYLTTGAASPGPNTEFSAARTVTAPVSTLDSLAAELGFDRLDFVKADVEGAELAVIDGGAATLERHRPALLLEIEDRHLAKYGARAADVADRLAAMGYRMRVWVARAWRDADRVREGHRNYLFTAEGADRRA